MNFTLPTNGVFAYHDNSLMNDHVMLLWVEKVLKNYFKSAGRNVDPFLELDSYNFNLLASVAEIIISWVLHVQLCDNL